MIKIGDDSYYFDCDDTLVMWVPIGAEPPQGSMMIPWIEGPIPAGRPQEGVWVLPHKPHIEALKAHAADPKASVVVWSAGGADWAENVVKALGLEEYVDVCIAKPTKYYDDLDCRMFMGHRTYIPGEGQ